MCGLLYVYYGAKSTSTWWKKPKTKSAVCLVLSLKHGSSQKHVTRNELRALVPRVRASSKIRDDTLFNSLEKR